MSASILQTAKVPLITSSRQNDQIKRSATTGTGLAGWRKIAEEAGRTRMVLRAIAFDDAWFARETVATLAGSPASFS
jgi:hypothetical protein